MRITTLVENHPHPSQSALKAEHGLSFYIEHNGHTFMSDVGASGAFADNAAVLGVDLARVEALAVSHHHYDHGGGLKRFFQENQAGKVYLRYSAESTFVGKVLVLPAVYIGLDQAVLRKNAERITYLKASAEVLPGLHLLTDIPLTYPKPSDKRLKIKSGGKFIEDSFAHELVTVLRDEQGLVLLTGCAHNGVLNMIAAVETALPGEPIRAVVGGFHLNHEKAPMIAQIGETLQKSTIPAFYSGHCTGDTAFEQLKGMLGDRLQRLWTGRVIDL